MIVDGVILGLVKVIALGFKKAAAAAAAAACCGLDTMEVVNP